MAGLQSLTAGIKNGNGNNTRYVYDAILLVENTGVSQNLLWNCFNTIYEPTNVNRHALWIHT